MLGASFGSKDISDSTMSTVTNGDTAISINSHEVSS